MNADRVRADDQEFSAFCAQCGQYVVVVAIQSALHERPTHPSSVAKSSACVRQRCPAQGRSRADARHRGISGKRVGPGKRLMPSATTSIDQPRPAWGYRITAYSSSPATTQYEAENAQKVPVSQRIRIVMGTEQAYSSVCVYRRGIGSGDSRVGGALGCGHAPVARMHSPI